MLGVAKLAWRAASHSARRSQARTHGSKRFWSCVTRSSPWLKRSAKLRRQVHLIGGGVTRCLSGALER